MKTKRKTTSGFTRKKKIQVKSKTKSLPIYVFLVIVALDQASKFLIKYLFLPGSSASVLGGVFSITYLRNTGSSFGLFKGYNKIFIIISIAVLALFIYKYFKKKTFRLESAIISAGILGNLLDRLFLGYVVDFIDFHFWPVFNAADSAISIGVLLLVFSMMKSKEDFL